MQKNTHEDGQTPRPLQWDDVRHFLALARLGSLSAAARQLAVEHSTVARRVGALAEGQNTGMMSSMSMSLTS